MTKKRKTKKRAPATAAPKRRRRRSTRGLSGLPARRPSARKNLQEELKNGMIDIVAMGAGAFAAAKGVSMLDKMINKSDNKIMGMASPAAALVAGVAGAAMSNNPIVKALAKGVAVGGGIKLAEKALGKDNLLSGVDGDDMPLMLPGIGEAGMANLPELPHYSENNDAPPTTTGADHAYHLPPSSEVLNGGEEFIAY